MSNNKTIEQMYALAKEIYAEYDIDTDEVIERLNKISLSLPCWQGDDVSGFEKPDSELSGGGIQVTGNYPGRARNIGELQMDLEKVFSLLPGKHRVNLHAIYGDFQGKNVDRDEIETDHFKNWISWALEQGLKLDFNATLFSHPKAAKGFTLSSINEGIREFWIEHCKRARKISTFIGSEQKSPCIHNLWIPDGFKDIPFDRWGYRERLKDSLDQIYEESYPKSDIKDAVESKLFGIGSEAYVVGSHEFYLGYALSNNLMVCLDLGHFHPTEAVYDKVSAVMQFSDELLLHISRGVRWDSDHAPIFNDDLIYICQQIVRNNLENKIHIALDFFDASINRIGAYVIGARSVLQALLFSLLEPAGYINAAEYEEDYFKRLAYMEIAKTLPFGAVWDYYCYANEVMTGFHWIAEVKDYENQVLLDREE